VIRTVQPNHIVVVGASIAPLVRQAANAARYAGETTNLPFPLRKWRAHFVRELAAALAADSNRPESAPKAADR
jgi:hypothetical protein